MTQVASVPMSGIDEGYYGLERSVSEKLATVNGDFPLFQTDAANLFGAYLAGLPEETRQHYNCHSCRRFIETYGALVQISEKSGLIWPFLWNVPAREPFAYSLANMQNIVADSRVTGVFYTKNRLWGTPASTGKKGECWSHLHGTTALPWPHLLKTPEQAMAEKKQDYIMLKKALAEIPQEAAVQAVRVLEADAVDRSEKTLGVAKWFLELHRLLADTPSNRHKDNLVWMAVAKAPPGWCHIRSSMIGTLLDDVLQGLPYESIKRRWNEKMHPLQYQRPTAVKEGNLEQANKLVEKLGSAGSLARRFARLDEVSAIWASSGLQEAVGLPGRPFDHLKEKSRTVKAVELPPQKLNWERFLKEVLPTAARMEIRTPTLPGPFFGFVTAVNPQAPPILQWDGLESYLRNPVSWFFYVGGSYSTQWNLPGGQFVEVNVVCRKPCHWQKPESFSHHGEGVFFILEGAKSLQHQQGGGFFPEQLRSEYHGIRAAMEAHAHRAEIVGKEEGSANGLALQKGDSSPLHVRVKVRDGTSQDYLLSY